MRDRVQNTRVAGREKRVVAGAGSPIAEIAVLIGVEVNEIGGAAVGGGIARCDPGEVPDARRRVVEEIERGITWRSAKVRANQHLPAHDLGKLVSDHAEKIVLIARRRAAGIGGVVVHQAGNVSEAGIAVDAVASR